MGMLKKAENKMAYAKVGIYGEAGAGKTFTAAKIAIGLHQFAGCTKPVGMFDTEPAASYIMPYFKEAGIEFLVYDESRALTDLMAFMAEAEKECSIVIIDSVTHLWRDVQDSYLAKMNAERKKKGKYPITQLEFQHWKPIKAAWGQFTDRYLASNLHVIVCGRAGSIYEYQKNEETGKSELITTGTKMATEKELGYEPSLLMEMVKRPGDGKKKITNWALIEKDRAAKLNGLEIFEPDFEKLRPHFEFLNIGGQHAGSMSNRDSQEMFTAEGDDNFGYELRQRTIWCEEIQGLLSKHYPGQTAEHKKTKADLLERFLDTRSWTKVESTSSDKLKCAFEVMKEHFDRIEEAFANTDDPGQTTLQVVS